MQCHSMLCCTSAFARVSLIFFISVFIFPTNICFCLYFSPSHSHSLISIFFASHSCGWLASNSEMRWWPVFCVVVLCGSVCVCFCFCLDAISIYLFGIAAYRRWVNGLPFLFSLGFRLLPYRLSFQALLFPVYHKCRLYRCLAAYYSSKTASSTLTNAHKPPM